MKLRKNARNMVCGMCPLRTDNYYCVLQRMRPEDYTLKNKKALDKDDSNQRIFA